MVAATLPIYTVVGIIVMLVLLWLVAEYFKDKTERERFVRTPITITVLIAILAIYNSYEGLA